MANGYYAIYVAIGLAATLVIVFVLAAGNTEQAYAPAPCPNCAIQVNGSGFGTITVPENSEIGPAPCDACFASLSFNATVLPDAKKHEATGMITITYLEDSVEHTITGDITAGEIKTDSFKASDGTVAAFEGVKVMITSIPTET